MYRHLCSFFAIVLTALAGCIIIGDSFFEWEVEGIVTGTSLDVADNELHIEFVFDGTVFENDYTTIDREGRYRVTILVAASSSFPPPVPNSIVLTLMDGTGQRSVSIPDSQFSTEAGEHLQGRIVLPEVNFGN